VEAVDVQEVQEILAEDALLLRLLKQGEEAMGFCARESGVDGLDEIEELALVPTCHLSLSALLDQLVNRDVPLHHRELDPGEDLLRLLVEYHFVVLRPRLAVLQVELGNEHGMLEEILPGDTLLLVDGQALKEEVFGD